MLKGIIHWLFLLVLLSIVSCADDDGVGSSDKYSMLGFEFPQGNDPWDKEIEQIAKDWDMYIIYKNVDSTHLNRMWTTPFYNDPIYVCTTPSSDDIQVYLELVKKWLLGSLDNNKKDDMDQLPYYLYLVNDLNDGNPRSQSYMRNHIQLKKDGLDYWCLSFTKEELVNGLTSEKIHKVASAFSYPGMKVRFASGEYVIPEGFAKLTDYETRIGSRYQSLEEFIAYYANVGVPYNEADYLRNVHVCERTIEHEYKRRGFVPQIGEDFKPVPLTSRGDYGAPTWMPWILGKISTPIGDRVDDRNRGRELKTVEERVNADFMNMIRFAMTYSKDRINTMYPVDAEEEYTRRGNLIINEKYELVVNYMRDTYNVDLQKYADILDE